MTFEVSVLLLLSNGTALSDICDKRHSIYKEIITLARCQTIKEDVLPASATQSDCISYHLPFYPVLVAYTSISWTFIFDYG